MVPKGALHGFRIANLAGAVWNSVLGLAGAVVLEDAARLLSALTAKGAGVRATPDFVLIDPLHFIDGLADSAEAALIRHCLEERAAPVVTSEWLIYCAQLGKPVDPSVSPLFVYNPNVCKPQVVRCGEEGAKERYVVKDVVYFNADATSDRRLGRIEEFLRRNVKSAMQVRVSPLALTGDGSELVVSETKESTVLLSADRLCGRPVVLSWAAYRSAEYAVGDPSTLACSEEWGDRAARALSLQSRHGSRPDICFSQDY